MSNQATIADRCVLNAIPRLPVSSSLVAMVPRTNIRSPRLRSGKIVFRDPKRVLHTNHWDQLLQTVEAELNHLARTLHARTRQAQVVRSSDSLLCVPMPIAR